MKYEYKVVEIRNVIKMPSLWQWPSAQSGKFTESLEAMLNQMSSEDWELVSPCVAAQYFTLIFRREIKK